MDRKDRVMVWCTIAIIVTMLGCSWWILYSIEDIGTWILRDLEGR